MEGKNKSSVKFTDTDNDSEISVKTKHLRISDTPVTISDSISPPETREGYISVPSKLSLNIFIGLFVQSIALAITGTGMWVSLKNDQANLSTNLARIEANMYTNSEAKLRLEMQDAKIEQLRKELEVTRGK